MTFAHVLFIFAHSLGYDFIKSLEFSSLSETQFLKWNKKERERRISFLHNYIFLEINGYIVISESIIIEYCIMKMLDEMIYELENIVNEKIKYRKKISNLFSRDPYPASEHEILYQTKKSSLFDYGIKTEEEKPKHELVIIDDVLDLSDSE